MAPPLNANIVQKRRENSGDIMNNIKTNREHQMEKHHIQDRI